MRRLHVTTALFLAGSINSLMSAPAQATDFLYNLRLMPAVDRTELDVTVDYLADRVENQTIGLPRDWYGSGDAGPSIKIFEGLNGTRVKPGGTASERAVRPNRSGWVSLHYRLSYDPNGAGAYSFGPSTGPDFAHFAGSQYLLRIGDPKDQSRFWVRLDAPENWRLYSSFSNDPSTEYFAGTNDGMMATALGGGSGPYSRILIAGRPVQIFAAGNYDVPFDVMARDVHDIIENRRERFNDLDHSFYTVAIRPRAENLAGMRIDHMFVMFLDSKVDHGDFDVLLAHEGFHDILPGRLQIVDPASDDLLSIMWFQEGFTEYLSRQLLVEQHILALSDAIDRTNRELLRLANNPSRSSTLAEVRAAAKAGRFNNAYRKLHYDQGSLLALRWDVQMRDFSHGQLTLADVIIRAIGAAPNGKLPLDQFLALVSKYGVDAKGDFTRYIAEGKPVDPPTNFLGSDARLNLKAMPRFELGFDLPASLPTLKLIRVQPDSAAYRAGLRDGMKLVEITNQDPQANSWRKDDPIKITLESNGTTRNLEYFPRGGDISVPQYSKPGS